MSSQETWINTDEQESAVSSEQTLHSRSGFYSATGIYSSLHQLGKNHQVPISSSDDHNIATFVLSQFPHPFHGVSRVALIDSVTNSRVTYFQLHRSIKSLAAALYHALGIRKGDVVFLISPNSVLYPTICLAVLSVGAVLTTSNPVNTGSEIAKQVRDSGAKLAISSPEELHKLVNTSITYTIVELIEESEPLDAPKIKCSKSDTAALLYSSGTTGVSKGVILTHSNFICILNLLKWTAEVTSSRDDIYLSFIPMFHIYGLAFFGLGMLSLGNTTVVMPKFDFQAMLEAVETHKVSQITAVPPVILALLSSLRRVGSGAAPLSKEIAQKFRQKFPWVELREGYGLTETCGAASFFVVDEQAKTHAGSVGQLLPGIHAKVVDVETKSPVPPYKEGELWLKGDNVMKGYLRNDKATTATIDSEGWLKTGDLCYMDADGFLYIVDRIKELIKHNGFQVAPAELEAILVSHPLILDAAVIPVENEESGQMPMAYVVRANDLELTEDQVIQFISGQVAPYKKVRKVAFINSIPRSAAGKILRKELVLMQNKEAGLSKL
ncbi:hypothetical protein MKW92_038634 [Papaver armeniacum]|nr:hypothetical protein MKW92_038634 [Papaver armeniacum]